MNWTVAHHSVPSQHPLKVLFSFAGRWSMFGILRLVLTLFAGERDPTPSNSVSRPHSEASVFKTE